MAPKGKHFAKKERTPVFTKPRMAAAGAMLALAGGAEAANLLHTPQAGPERAGTERTPAVTYESTVPSREHDVTVVSTDEGMPVTSSSDSTPTSTDESKNTTSTSTVSTTLPASRPLDSAPSSTAPGNGETQQPQDVLTQAEITQRAEQLQNSINSIYNDQVEVSVIVQKEHAVDPVTGLDRISVSSDAFGDDAGYRTATLVSNPANGVVQNIVLTETWGERETDATNPSVTTMFSRGDQGWEISFKAFDSPVSISTEQFAGTEFFGSLITAGPPMGSVDAARNQYGAK